MRIILNPGLFYFIVFTLVLSMGNTESARGQQRRLDLQFEILALQSWYTWPYHKGEQVMKSGKCTRIVKGLFGLQRIVD